MPFFFLQSMFRPLRMLWRLKSQSLIITEVLNEFTRSRRDRRGGPSVGKAGWNKGTR